MERRLKRALHAAAACVLSCCFVAAPSFAALFAGGNVGLIPDGSATGLDVTFNVSGIAHPIDRVSLQMTIQHPYVGDLEAILTSPGGVAHLVLFSRTKVSPASSNGASSNLDGNYSFDDSAPADWWSSVAPLSSTDTLPSGRYRTSTGGTPLSNHGGCVTSLTTAFAGLTGGNVNGTWTLRVADRSPIDTGVISAALLSVIDDEVFSNTFDSVRGSCKLAQFDFTGTGRSSYVVVRNTGGGPSGAITWFVKDNDGTTSGAPQSFPLGIASDTFLSGDFDGDGIADAAVWSSGAPGVAALKVRRSSRPGDTPLSIVFGQTGDDPKHVGDYDGDGIDDFAVYRAGAMSGDASHTLIRLSGSGSVRDLITGENGAFPAGGVDYTGDGRADMAIQANAGGGVASFRIYDGTTGSIVDNFNFGTPVDIVVVGNQAGDVRYDINVVRASGGVLQWNTRDSGTGIAQATVPWGVSATDYLLSGDFDGDGYDDAAIWEPNANAALTIFNIRPSSNPAVPIVVNFGQNGDYPVGNSRTH